ncbi:MAG: tRNA 4-thiouridine(8) synthase ThiI [Nitrospinaceae bacterium]|nr:tRNA 4-thiouridine(8) synthase ThiI [Nitrospinaceae bacterium]
MTTNGTQNIQVSNCFILHYNEIGLKGKNRPHFIRLLAKRIERAATPHNPGRLHRLHGRFILDITEDTDREALISALSRVFGLAYFAPAKTFPLDLETVAEGVIEMIAPMKITSFAVRTRREHKGVPASSREWDPAIGARIQARRRLPVNLSEPSTTVHIEALKDRAIAYAEKIPGPGGLPIGASGRVAALLSGGIDSPVAALRMMRRGCEVIFVHFHGAPYLSRASAGKAGDLAEILDGYQLGSRLYLVPFGTLQKDVVLSAPAADRVVIYRRFMVRITERIAALEGALALVTGESLAQVASQTLSNMAAVEEAATLPILRPLVGMDKEEIIAEARALGSFEISIEPDQDCCTLFVPKHPATKSKAIFLRRAESKMPAEEMIDRALAESEVLEINAGKRPVSRLFGEVHSEEVKDGAKE